MADVMTLQEKKGPLGGTTVAWSGDGNNVATSWVHAAVRFGFALRLACPKELSPAPALLDWARARGRPRHSDDRPARGGGGRRLRRHRHLGLDGRPRSGGTRHNLLAPYRVDEALMALAKPDAIFMHCLPVKRGEEVTAGVIDGPQSVVWDEAENRLHAQKGILTWCLD